MLDFERIVVSIVISSKAAWNSGFVEGHAYHETTASDGASIEPTDARSR
jgi:hypothetical protein